MADFYAELAPRYHQIFSDWDASIAFQGEALSRIVQGEWPGHRSVLDVSCGIGTQAIALSRNGFWVKGSDSSAVAVERARGEAAQRGLVIEFVVCDMRHAFECHGGGFDIVLSADNAVAHLLDDAQIEQALASMFACTKPGGGCLLTLRDYACEPRGRGIVKPYHVRESDGKRFLGVQVWDFDGDRYDMTLYLVDEDLVTGAVAAQALHTRLYAISVERLLVLMQHAGFERVRRLDGAFYQPVVVGTRPA